MIQGSSRIESLSSACSDDAISKAPSNCLSELIIQFPELGEMEIPFKAKQLLESRACSYPLKTYKGSPEIAEVKTQLSKVYSQVYKNHIYQYSLQHAIEYLKVENRKLMDRLQTIELKKNFKEPNDDLNHTVDEI